MDGLQIELLQGARACLDEYERVNRLPNGGGSVLEIVSGGIRRNPRDPFPALYLDDRMAIEAWGSSVTAFVIKLAGAGGRIRIVRPPDLVKLLMTETDMRQMQRIAKERWAVTAMVAVEGYDVSN